MEERLQKVLARAGFASRRGAEALMQEGRVTVDGAVVRELGTKADPSRDDIRVDGVRVKVAAGPVHIVLNKPRGVVSTRRDPSGRPTVMDLVPGVSGLFPIGRLDLTTEGLILLTNDGAFAEKVSHPRYEVPRVYHAKVRGVPDARALERLRRGVRVKDERLAADGARVIEVDRHAWVEVTLHEGKQHEVKRLLEAVGHPVSKLRRVAVGPVTLRGLAPGQFRTLTPREISGLLRGEGSAETPRRRPRPAGKRKITRGTPPVGPRRSTGRSVRGGTAAGARPERAKGPRGPSGRKGVGSEPRRRGTEQKHGSLGAGPRKSRGKDSRRRS